MDRKTSKKQIIRPHYSRIYRDLIALKFPNHLHEFQEFIVKDNLTDFEIEELNKRLFKIKSKEQNKLLQRYKAYNEKTIMKILRYQKKHQLTNTQVAGHFNVSRNTITSWRKTFSYFT